MRTGAFLALILLTTFAFGAAASVARAEDDPPQNDSTEAPVFYDQQPLEPADPDVPDVEDPEAPDEEPCAPPRMCLPMTFLGYGVTWSNNENIFKFRNADGIWWIYKRCFDRTVVPPPPQPPVRFNAGPGYIVRVFDTAHPSRVLVDDYRARTDVTAPGYLNGVNGGLGTFGLHFARGAIDNTPAGDDPTTPGVEVPVDRNPGFIEGRMCANTNNGFGVYARNWMGPSRISRTEVRFTMDVWLRDGTGNTGYGPGGNAIMRIRYRYTFFRSSVRTWISVLIYPRLDVGGIPFVKEPKFSATLRGVPGLPLANFRRMAVFGGSDGMAFQKGIMMGRPEGTAVLVTDHSDANGRVRVRWDYGTSLTTEGSTPCSGGPCFNVVMRSYATTADGNILRGQTPSAWENSLGRGLDGWAGASASRGRSYPRDTRGGDVVTSCSVPLTPDDDLNHDGQYDEVERSYASERATPGIDGVRRWEHGGWKNNLPDGSSPDDNPNPYIAAMTLFNGWEGARGFNDCEVLQRAFGSGQESWGTFAIYSVGAGWERLR